MLARAAFSVLVGVFLIAPYASGADLVAHLESPTKVSRSSPFKLKITVSNVSQQAWLFKRYSSWTSDAMYLEASGPDGIHLVNEPVFFDSDIRYECFSVKHLDIGESHSFEFEVNGELGIVPLPFPRTGKYTLKWKYVGHRDDSAKKCSIANVRYWSGDLESNSLEIEVGP
jgi:hypothetical protein